MYIGKLDDIVNKYNNIYNNTIKMKPIQVKDNTYMYYRTIKMKPIQVKDNTYINFGKESNDKDPKFKVANDVRISKYKNTFAEGYISNLSKEVFVIKKCEKYCSMNICY